MVLLRESDGQATPVFSIRVRNWLMARELLNVLGEKSVPRAAKRED